MSYQALVDALDRYAETTRGVQARETLAAAELAIAARLRLADDLIVAGWLPTGDMAQTVRQDRELLRQPRRAIER